MSPEQASGRSNLLDRRTEKPQILLEQVNQLLEKAQLIDPQNPLILTYAASITSRMGEYLAITEPEEALNCIDRSSALCAEALTINQTLWYCHQINGLSLNFWNIRADFYRTKAQNSCILRLWHQS